MAIRFQCRECGQKIRVADSFAGRRSNCPKCRKPVRVPAAGVGNGSGAELPVSPADRDAVANEASERVPAEHTAAAFAPPPPPGEPDLADEPARADEPVGADAAQIAGAAKAGLQFVRFNCPDCGKPTGFPLRFAGAPGVCPKCRARIMVPREGEEPFLIGALPDAQAKRGGVKPRRALRLAGAWGRISRARRAPAKGILLFVVGAVGLALAVFIIWNELRGGGVTARPQPRVPRVSATRDTRPAAIPAPPSTQPPQAEVIQEREPEVPAPQAAPAEVSIPELAPPQLEIGIRPDAAPVTSFDPIKAFNLSPGPKPGTDVDEGEEPARRKTAVKAPPASPLEAETERAPSQPPEEPPVEAPAFIRPPEGAAPPQPAALPNQALEPPDVCAECGGATWLPLQKYVPYVYMERDAAPPPELGVPWRPCPKCQPGFDPKKLAEEEGARRAVALASHQRWEQQLGFSLEWGETRHVAVHAELSPATARLVVTTLDRLTAKLQADTKSTVLTMTRPDTHELLILWDTPGYLRMLDLMAQQYPGPDWELPRKATGVTSRNRCFFNAHRGRVVPVENMAVFQVAHMLMDEATEARATPWLREGFSSYCENLILQKNLCYSFTYQPNEVKFGPNWNLEIRKYAQQGKLKTWPEIFPMDLIGSKAIEYLTAYSMVSFLVCDPDRFLKFLHQVRYGVDIPRALERAYGKTVAELQTMWTRWMLSVR